MSLGSVLFSVPARTVKYVAYISGQTSDTFAVYCRRGACQNLTHPPTRTHTHTQSFLCHLLAPHVRSDCSARSRQYWLPLESPKFAVRILHNSFSFSLLLLFSFSHFLLLLAASDYVCVCPIVVSLTNCFKLHFHNVFLCGLKYLLKA